MNVKKHSVTKAEIERVMRAASECGQSVREVVMTPSEVRVIFEGGVDLRNPQPETAKPKEWPRSGY